ncbi:MAG: MBL fold metallo-hydrolase [Archaeoglobaceae archaeon]
MVLTISEQGGVKVVKCGNEVGGKVLYWVHFFSYGGVLFDSGCPHTANEVFSAFKEKEAVLLTHYHEDHIGGAIELQKAMPIYAPRKSLDILRNPPQIPQYRKIVWGQPSAVNANELEEIVKIGSFEIEVIDTPGHSFDHVSFLVGKNLFCGDLVITRGQIVCMREERLLETIKSLKKVLSYDFDFAFSGVGVFPREKVEDYLNYLEELRGKILNLWRAGKTIDEIVAEVFPNPNEKALMMEIVSEKEWARENMVKSLLEDVRGNA